MMDRTITLTSKQKEFIRNANKRWNLKTGATRSGKSYEDTHFQILDRIIERDGLDGLNVIIGVSKATIERNVLRPMRETYTNAIVGSINANNIVLIAGQEVYCLGAEKASQVAKIQGSSIKYCYGDEVAKWNQEVFEMLKSRLDKPYSCFDGSLNPESPTHWLKAFIDDEQIDKYVQEYTIFDNPFLPKEFVTNLCKEYEGTVYYQRYILGKWARAEGSIYMRYADNPSKYRVNDKWIEEHPLVLINIGIDFSLGGNASDHTFVATGFTKGYKEVVALASRKIKGNVQIVELERMWVEFVKYIQDKYKKYFVTFNRAINCYGDAADQVFINSFKRISTINRLAVNLLPAKKDNINERIQLELRLIGLDRLYVHEEADTVNNALIGAVWNDKPGHEDERLDNGTSDIDTLDAFEYSIERERQNLIYELERKGG